MPKRSRSGVVSSPARVVAPISVNGGRSSVTTRAPAPDADRDRQLPVLHRGIEGLLDRARQPVDLVDEEHRARLERGAGRRRCRPCARAPGRRSSVNGDVELGGDDLRQRRLAEPGRAGSSTWSSGSPRARGRLDRMPSCAFSASWPTNSSSRRGRRRASCSSSSGALGAWMRSRRRRRACGSPARRLQRVGDQVLGRVARRAVEQRCRPPAGRSRGRPGRRGRARAGRRRA